MRGIPLVLAAALTACAPTHPMVDMNNVDPVAYQRAFDGCEAVAGPSDAAGPAIAGLVIGGSVGLGLGVLISGISTGTAAGYGVASGAVAGTAAGAAAGSTGAGEAVSPAPPQSLDQCLAAHGYKIIGHI